MKKKKKKKKKRVHTQRCTHVDGGRLLLQCSTLRVFVRQSCPHVTFTHQQCSQPNDVHMLTISKRGQRPQVGHVHTSSVFTPLHRLAMFTHRQCLHHCTGWPCSHIVSVYTTAQVGHVHTSSVFTPLHRLAMFTHRQCLHHCTGWPCSHITNVYRTADTGHVHTSPMFAQVGQVQKLSVFTALHRLAMLTHRQCLQNYTGWPCSHTVSVYRTAQVGHAAHHQCLQNYTGWPCCTPSVFTALHRLAMFTHHQCLLHYTGWPCSLTVSVYCTTHAGHAHSPSVFTPLHRLAMLTHRQCLQKCVTSPGPAASK